MTGLGAVLSGTNANDFIIAQPNETTLSSAVPSTTFTVKAQDGLAVGTYNATVSVSADHMTEEKFTVTQVVYAVEPTMIVSALPGDGYVDITWKSVGMEGYKVFQSTVSGSYGSAVDTVGGSVYSSKITGLVNGTTYFFVVRSTHGGIESQVSNEVSRIPQVTAPAAPVLQSAVAGDGHVNLSWNSVVGSKEYQIFSSNTAGSYGAPLATVNGSVYAYDAVGLVNGMTYYYVLKASNPGGDSAASNELSAVPQVASPSVPSISSAAAGNGQVRLTWNGVAGSAGYKIYKSTVGGTYAAETTTVSSSVYSYEATDLINGTTYTFKVKAVNSAGSSEASVASNEVTPRSFSNNGNSGSSGAAAQLTTGVDVLFHGKQEQIGTATTRIVDGQTVTTITFDPKKLAEKLAAEDQKAVLTIPVSTASDVVIGEFDGQMVRSMEQKQAVVVIQTASTSYTLPAQQIDINSIIEKFAR